MKCGGRLTFSTVFFVLLGRFAFAPRSFDAVIALWYRDSIKMPDAKSAFVERDKILGYLLNRGHRFGAGKARFFESFGFRIEQWEVLAEAFQEHGQVREVTNVQDTGFGPRYEVEGPLRTPDGRNPLVRTVWQRDLDAPAPRLITAYPVEKKR